MNCTCRFEDVTQLNNASPEEHVMSGCQDGRSDGTLVEELAASIARVSDSVFGWVGILRWGFGKWWRTGEYQVGWSLVLWWNVDQMTFF